MCVRRDYSGWPRRECDRAFLLWQQCSQSNITYDARVNPRSQSSLTRALTQQTQAPEARVPIAADHEVAVDRDAERLGGVLDLLLISMSSHDCLGSSEGWLCTSIARNASC